MRMKSGSFRHEVIHELTLARGKMKTRPITASDTFPLEGERSG
jgi:hypothetical protein